MTIKQAIILASGSGTRLLPLTQAYQKNLVPVNGKFIIDYSIETLRNLGITDLIVVLGGNHFDQIVSYLRNGSSFGFKSVSYFYQEEMNGISSAINLCKNAIIDEKFLVLLGDNIFDKEIKFPNIEKYGCQIILNQCKNLSHFGVASIKNNAIEKIEEKPKLINNIDYYNAAITGLYLFDQKFFEYFKLISPSKRKEYEITDIINKYKEENDLGYYIYNGMWCDAGTHENIKFLNDFFWNKKNK